LVRNLERSKRFLAPRLTGEAAQAKETGTGTQNNNVAVNSLAPAGVEFEILANYNPLPPGESYASGKAAKKDVETDAVEPHGGATSGGVGSAKRHGAAVPQKAGAR